MYVARVMVVLVLTAIGAASVGACGGEEQSGSGLEGTQLTMVGYGGEGQEIQEAAYASPFAEETGVRIAQDSPFDYSKLQAQVESGNVSWDVVSADPFATLAGCGKLYERLTDVDFSRIAPEFRTGGECGMPVDWFVFQIVYRKDKVGEDPPTGWRDFFDTEKYPGKRAVWNYVLGNLFEAALLADGVSPDQLYPLDYDRAIRKLETIKDDLVFYDSFAQATEQLVSGEVVMSSTVQHRAWYAAREGAPVAPVWNQAILSWNTWAIPKGSQHVEAAQALLDYMGRSEAQATSAKRSGYGMTAVGDEPKATGTLARFFGSGTRAKRAIPMDQGWYAKHFDEANQRFTDFVSG